jgi:hypothetical protein
MSTGFTRRSFLGTVLATVAGALSGWSCTRTPQQAILTGDTLQALLPHRDSAVRLGRHYLAAIPQEADAPRLRTLLAGALGDAQTATGALHERVHQAIRADFAAGRVVDVNGWLLSQTEARLCALLSLTGTPPEAAPGVGQATG